MVISRLFAALRNTALGLVVGAGVLGTGHAAVVNVSASQSSDQLGGAFRSTSTSAGCRRHRSVPSTSI